MKSPQESANKSSSSCLPRAIHLTFAVDATPGLPIPLDRESLEKLDDTPNLLRAFANFLGSAVDSPKMFGGGLIMDFSIELVDYDPYIEIIAALQLTASELVDNSNRQPPRPTAQAVTHFRCVDMLRALSRAHASSGLVAKVHIDNKEHELPHIPLALFVEPSKECVKHLRQKIVGVCLPGDDYNRVVLSDDSFLQLPLDDYREEYAELCERIQQWDVLFTGQALISKKGTYRAIAGGSLHAQGILQPPGDADA